MANRTKNRVPAALRIPTFITNPSKLEWENALTITEDKKAHMMRTRKIIKLEYKNGEFYFDDIPESQIDWSEILADNQTNDDIMPLAVLFSAVEQQMEKEIRNDSEIDWDTIRSKEVVVYVPELMKKMGLQTNVSRLQVGKLIEKIMGYENIIGCIPRIECGELVGYIFSRVMVWKKYDTKSNTIIFESPYMYDLKHGTYYKDAWYYVCKHRKLIDGEKCTYKRQPPQDPINNEVLAILASFVDYEGNEAVMQGVMGEKTDTDAIYQRIDGLEKQKARKVAAKDRLTAQIDNLDPDDPNYDTIYDDLDERLRKIYIEIAEINKQIEDARSDLQSEADARFTQMTAMEMLKAIGDKLPTMTDAHKKEICQAMLERVELFPERQEDGRYVRNVKFRFPVMERGDEKEADKWWYNENPVETVVLMSRVKD